MEIDLTNKPKGGLDQTWIPIFLTILDSMIGIMSFLTVLIYDKSGIISGAVGLLISTFITFCISLYEGWIITMDRIYHEDHEVTLKAIYGISLFIALIATLSGLSSLAVGFIKANTPVIFIGSLATITGGISISLCLSYLGWWFW